MKFISIKRSDFISGRQILKCLLEDKFVDFYIASGKLTSHIELIKCCSTDADKVSMTAAGGWFLGKKTVGLLWNQEAMFLPEVFDFALSYELPYCAIAIVDTQQCPWLKKTIAESSALKPLRFVYFAGSLIELYADTIRAMQKTVKYRFPAVVVIDETIFFAGVREEISRFKARFPDFSPLGVKDETVNLLPILSGRDAIDKLAELFVRFEKISISK